MSDIFKLLHSKKEDRQGRKGVFLGIHVRIGEREMDFPVSETCTSEGELSNVVASLRENLERVLEEGKKVLGAVSLSSELGIQPGMSGKEIWAILAQIQNENEFAERFNSLEDEQRVEVAEHVLTECNVFSGRAATFSARYNSQTTLLE